MNAITVIWLYWWI